MNSQTISENKSVHLREIFLSSLTPELDGSSGKYRAPIKFKLITPSNDPEAISTFLQMHASSVQTYRGYEKELTRLHMWAVIKAGIALSSMSLNEYRNYLKFISEPDDDWCGNRSSITTSNWRPFQPKKYDAHGNLIKPSVSSLRFTVAAISSYIDWLCKGGYLIGNPLSIIKAEFINKNLPTVRDVNKNSNYFDNDSFEILMKTLESMPRGSLKEIHDYEIKRIIFTLIYHLNAKTIEISCAKMSNFIKVREKWYWIVERNKAQVDSILLNEEMLDSLKRWRLHLDLSELPERNEKLPLLPPVTKFHKPLYYRGGITPRRITGLLRELISLTIENITKTDPDKALQLQYATSHWLRYTKLRKMAKLKRESIEF